jgi:hypothetical protein
VVDGRYDCGGVERFWDKERVELVGCRLDTVEDVDRVELLGKNELGLVWLVSIV